MQFFSVYLDVEFFFAISHQHFYLKNEIVLLTDKSSVVLCLKFFFVKLATR